MKNKYIDLIRNIGIFTIANFTSRILSFLILPLYTYYLSTEEFGTIDLVSTLIQLAFPFFSLAITDAAMRFGLSAPEKKEEVFTIGFSLVALGSLPLLLIACGAGIFLDNKAAVAFFVVIYFVQALNSLFAAFSKAIDKTREMAVITTVTGFSILALNVLFVAVLRWGILGYWTSVVIGNTLGVILYLTVCRLHRYIRWDIRDRSSLKPLLRQMLSYSIPLVPNALFWWINSSLDKWTLTAMAGVSVVGLYACANKIPTILSTVNSIFHQAWNISMFQDNGEEGRSRFYREIHFFYSEIMFCCSIGIIMLSKPVAALMFSRDFYAAWRYVPLLTFGLFYNSLSGFMGSLFTASKQTKYIFTTTCLGAVVNLALNIPFVYFWGAEGAALATLVSYLTVWLARKIRIAKLFGIRTGAAADIFQLVFLGVETLLVMGGRQFPLVVLSVGLYCIVFLLRCKKRIWRK